MKTSKKQNLTSDLLNAGFTKKDFTLKKVGGFLTLIVNELNEKSFGVYILAKKYFVDFQYNGFVYGIQSIEKETGYAYNNTSTNKFLN